jgi:hypothetical protein
MSPGADRAAKGAAYAMSGEDVAQLAEALRAAKRSHGQYLAELRQGDVEPAEDWATWYAEYLLAGSSQATFRYADEVGLRTTSPVTPVPETKENVDERVV